MSEAYFRVESGALGPEENFLSLDDILMSHEKLPVHTETPIPRLGTFFLDRSGGAESDNAIPEVSLLARIPARKTTTPSGPRGLGAPRHRARCPLRLVVFQEAEPRALPSCTRGAQREAGLLPVLRPLERGGLKA
uniref:DNA replication complex GINS protein PSF3 N-terminal domain-containing protein n=1 Tax=Equus asinus asinus TaxID=83772 RepID=A0A8C4L915_EQUAS